MKSIDWTLCSGTQMEHVTSDVIAPSPWTIFGCQNGSYKFITLLVYIAQFACLKS